MNTGKCLFALGTILALVGCSTPPPAPVAKAPEPIFKPVISINDVMVSVVDHNSHKLWDVALDKKAPKNSAEWHELEHAAVTLASAGAVISRGGSGAEDAKWAADADWQTYTEQMTQAALKAVNAVKSENLPGLLAAGDDLVVTCETCHKKFKPAIPAHVAKPGEQPEHFGH